MRTDKIRKYLIPNIPYLFIPVSYTHLDVYKRQAFENKLGITDSAQLAREEEKISKAKAKELFESGILDSLHPGTYVTLARIHEFLFDEIYDFAGKMRTVNIAKGNFRFAPLMYLQVSLENIDKMPQSSYDEIIEKYVEMNIAHPFREGNGRSMRIWLDLILKKEIHQVIDWSKVCLLYTSYFLIICVLSIAMEPDFEPVSNSSITTLLICLGSGMLGGMLG